MSQDLQKRIQELEAEVERLRDLACKDELTGLYNRRGFKDASSKFLGEISNKNKFNNRASVLIKNFAIIVFDIDNFKKVNDTYGHDCGDLILTSLAKLIQDRVRDIDLATRWGGEEMVVGLVGANEHDAFNVANDIRKKLSQVEFECEDKKFSVTLSGGVAEFDSGTDFEAIFKRADEALYKAKESGKNRIIRHSEIA